MRSSLIVRAALVAGLLPFLGAPARGQAAGRTLFVGNNGNLEGSVTAFAVNDDGTLTFINRVITGTRPSTSYPCPGCNPYELSLTPDGRYLASGHPVGYTSNEQITIFEVAPDGSIAQLAAFQVPGTPMDVAWLTNELLAVTRTDPLPNEIVLYRWNPLDLSLTERDTQPVGNFSTYLAVHPSGDYVYINNSSGGNSIRAFRLEDDETLTQIDLEATGSYYPLELTITRAGSRLYSAGGITHVLTGFDLAADGSLTPLAGSPFPEFGSSPSNVFTSSDDAFLLVGHGTDATLRSAFIDAETGGLTYTGKFFDVGLQGTLGDVSAMDELVFVTDNSTAIDGVMGVYSFTLESDGSFTQNGDIYSTAGIAPRGLAAWSPAGVLYGDLNCDGALDAFDIDPFILALTDPDMYAELYPSCDILAADVNQDGVINAFDIDPFVELLTP